MNEFYLLKEKSIVTNKISSKNIKTVSQVIHSGGKVVKKSEYKVILKPKT